MTGGKGASIFMLTNQFVRHNKLPKLKTMDIEKILNNSNISNEQIDMLIQYIGKDQQKYHEVMNALDNAVFKKSFNKLLDDLRIFNH